MGKLVVIDDDQIFHRILRLMSLKLGIFSNISHYHEAGTILGYIRDNKTKADQLPDVLFIDLYMPGLSGWEFLDHLNQFFERLSKPIAVYVTSSSLNPADQKKAGQYPFVKEFLLKPVSYNKLSAIYQKMQVENAMLS